MQLIFVARELDVQPQGRKELKHWLSDARLMLQLLSKPGRACDIATHDPGQHVPACAGNRLVGLVAYISFLDGTRTFRGSINESSFSSVGKSQIVLAPASNAAGSIMASSTTMHVKLGTCCRDSIMSL